MTVAEQLKRGEAAEQQVQAMLANERRLLVEVGRLRFALEIIEIRASSDAPAEELEDTQRDLRYIHTTAQAALKE